MSSRACRGTNDRRAASPFDDAQDDIVYPRLLHLYPARTITNIAAIASGPPELPSDKTRDSAGSSDANRRSVSCALTVDVGRAVSPWHSAEQPSPSIRLPSSQRSRASSSTPSPHPASVQSRRQRAFATSAFALPSSHSSPPSTRAFPQKEGRRAIAPCSRHCPRTQRSPDAQSMSSAQNVHAPPTQRPPAEH